MKNYLIFILISLSIIFTFCVPDVAKKANVKIKVGVLMRSGDVKNVARQDFLIIKLDLISLWDVSKKQYLEDCDLGEKEIRAEMEFDNKINNLESEIKKIKESLFVKIGPSSPNIIKIVDGLATHVNFIKDWWGDDFRGQLYREVAVQLKPGKTTFKDAKKILNDCKKDHEIYIYGSWGKDPIIKKRWEKRLEKLNEINKLIEKLDKDSKRISSNIYKINEEKKKLEIELLVNISSRYGELRKIAIKRFQLNLKESLIKSFKTNLSGEASFTIEKGGYFLFCIAQIGQNNLIWNLPIEVKYKEHYFELSNDNAYSIDDDDLASELLEILERFEINNSN